MLDPNSVGTIVDQATLSTLAVWLIQKVKGATWFPFIQEGAKVAVRSFAALVASASAAGILITANWSGSEHTFQLAVAGLTASNVATFLWMALRGFVEQELIRRITK